MSFPIKELVKALTTNATDSSFPSKIPTATEPTNDGVISLKASGGWGYETLAIFPYGVGADDTTFDLRVIGWRKGSDLWVPEVIAGVSVILSTAVGVASKYVVATERFADTITVNTGIVVYSAPPANTVAKFLVDVSAYEKAEVTFDMTGATSGNALYAAF